MMNALRLIMLPFACLSLISASVSGAGTVVMDQVNTWPDSTWDFYVINVTPDFFEWQQEIVAGVSGQLVGIDLYPTGPEDVFILSINKGTAWQTDEDDFTARIETAGTNWGNLDAPAYIDLSTANIHLSAGETFVIGLTGTGDGSDFHYALNASKYDPVEIGRYVEPGKYIPGRLLLDAHQFGPPGNYQLQSGLDLAFRTYMLVPEPTCTTLLVVAAILFSNNRFRTAHIRPRSSHFEFN